MSIDWFTFSAQILNFVLLVWLLKRFLYRPILDAIEAREQRISDELKNAAELQAEAEEERERYRLKLEELEQQRDQRLAGMHEEVREEYERLLAEARDKVDALGRKRMQALKDNVDNLNELLGQRLQREVFAISGKILSELASQSLQDRMVDKFVSRLRSLDGDAAAALRKVVEADGNTLLLRSAFELSQEQQAAIRSALEDICAGAIDLHFDTEPALLAGIELVANGHKIAWSVSDYLAALEKSVGEVLPSAVAGECRAAEPDSPRGENA
jgi:F-type H+-transporting ATPase subunit b